MTKNKQTTCPVCGQKLSLIKQKINDNIKVCGKHFIEAGINSNEIISRKDKPFTIEEIKERMRLSEVTKDESQKEIGSFAKDKQIGNFIAFDEEKKKWALLSPFKGKVQQVYNYEDIVDFELLEDGNSVASGGLGRALVGGALFGGTGAIVGGVTGKKKTKEFCSSLRLKVTINNMANPVVYINFIETKIKKDGHNYKIISDAAQECLSTFQLICDRQDKEKTEDSNSSSSADEIMKFKNLLDAGAITQEEYETKKKELLGL